MSLRIYLFIGGLLLSLAVAGGFYFLISRNTELAGQIETAKQVNESNLKTIDTLKTLQDLTNKTLARNSEDAKKLNSKIADLRKVVSRAAAKDDAPASIALRDALDGLRAIDNGN